MSLDQRRAAFALNRVQAVKDKDYNTQYRAYTRKFPTIVLRSGLGQALAMELAQSNGDNEDNKGHKAVLNHVSAWLVARDGWGESSPYYDPHKTHDGDFINTDLINAIMAGSEQNMIHAQSEIMAYMKWLKTFAEALIPPGSKDEGAK